MQAHLESHSGGLRNVVWYKVRRALTDTMGQQVMTHTRSMGVVQDEIEESSQKLNFFFYGKVEKSTWNLYGTDNKEYR